MVDCAGPWTSLLNLGLFVLAPVALPLAGLALHSWRTGRRGSMAAAAGLAGVGFVGLLVAVLDHPGDPRWLPLPFLPPLVACAVAALLPTRALRLVALLTAPLPLVALLAYGVATGLSAPPCPA